MYTWCKCMNFTLKYNNYVPLKYLYCTQHIYDIPNYYEVLAATQIKHLVSLLYQIYRLLELQRGTQSVTKLLIHWLHLIGCWLKVYSAQHWRSSMLNHLWLEYYLLNVLHLLAKLNIHTSSIFLNYTKFFYNTNVLYLNASITNLLYSQYFAKIISSHVTIRTWYATTVDLKLNSIYLSWFNKHMPFLKFPLT